MTPYATGHSYQCLEVASSPGMTRSSPPYDSGFVCRSCPDCRLSGLALVRGSNVDCCRLFPGSPPVVGKEDWYRFSALFSVRRISSSSACDSARTSILATGLWTGVRARTGIDTGHRAFAQKRARQVSQRYGQRFSQEPTRSRSPRRCDLRIRLLPQ